MANELWLPNWRVLDASNPRSFEEPKVFTAECLDAPEACKHCGCVGRLYRHAADRWRRCRPGAGDLNRKRDHGRLTTVWH